MSKVSWLWPRWPMNASDIPCRVLLSQWQVHQVLGDKGEENLKRLRMASGANVQLLRGLRQCLQ